VYTSHAVADLITVLLLEIFYLFMGRTQPFDFYHHVDINYNSRKHKRLSANLDTNGNQ
jgi:hypothetical protein